MFCRSLLTITVAALHTASAAAAAAGPAGCVTFDIFWNLLAFGFNGKDYSAGTQDTWPSGSVTDITASGRPPFNSVNTTCYLSQFLNAIYVLNADSANPSSVYIYDAAAKSWSTQTVTTNNFQPTNFATILDHDTNVFYAFSNGEIYSLDMGSLKAANATPIPWTAVQQPDLSTGSSGTITPGANTAGYQPVLALANNHVEFLNVPGLPAGSAKIFVIHFSYTQPMPQSFGNFPNTYGRTASFFQDAGVQLEFAFIPSDGSSTYVINVISNTTKTLTGPATQDPFATYSASTSALVQLTTSGKVAYLAYNENTTTSGGTWATISQIPVANFLTSNSTSSTVSGSASKAKATSTSSGSSAPGTSGTPSSSGAVGSGGMNLVVSMALAVLLGFVGLVL